MKTCKKCTKNFPSTIWIKGKLFYLHQRSYCLECSPLHTRRGYYLRKENTKNKGDKQCPICERRFKYQTNDVCTACRAAIIRHFQRKRAYAILGNRCKNCGQEDIDILTCHHRNPEEKSFNLCTAWGSISWELIEKEIAKCDLLCCNCHQKLHARETQRRFKLIEDYLAKRPRGEIGSTQRTSRQNCLRKNPLPVRE